MARILYAWELGGGLGHLTRIYPILLALERRGHQVSAAIRESNFLDKLWPELRAPVQRAPHKTQPSAYEIHPVKYYVDILNNVGWGEIKDLQLLLRGWQELYSQLKPDFVIHDHSPTALLISQTLGIRHATLGTGFCSPVDETPTRLMRTWKESEPDAEKNISSRIVENLRTALPAGPPIERPTQIYSRVNENFLTTFAELDHFGERPEANYWGIPNVTAGTRPAWPSGTGPKLFAYLHADSSLPAVLQAIERLNFPTLIYINGKASGAIVSPSASVKIVAEPVDLTWAAAECSLGILNGSHGVTAAFLLAGRPILQLPIQLEQYLGAKRSVELGAALIVDRFKPEDISPSLHRLLNDPRFAIRADQFRDQYRSWSPEAQAQKIVERIEELLK
jgi:UDP:flavonoid glycosyltransferase YjiC (YdhE family)